MMAQHEEPSGSNPTSNESISRVRLLYQFCRDFIIGTGLFLLIFVATSGIELIYFALRLALDARFAEMLFGVFVNLTLATNSALFLTYVIRISWRLLRSLSAESPKSANSHE